MVSPTRRERVEVCVGAFCSHSRDGTVAVYSKYFGEAPKDENGVAIGGAESYRPVCRKHYLVN